MAPSAEIAVTRFSLMLFFHLTPQTEYYPLESLMLNFVAPVFAFNISRLPVKRPQAIYSFEGLISTSMISPSNFDVNIGEISYFETSSNI